MLFSLIKKDPLNNTMDQVIKKIIYPSLNYKIAKERKQNV